MKRFAIEDLDIFPRKKLFNRFEEGKIIKIVENERHERRRGLDLKKFNRKYSFSFSFRFDRKQPLCNWLVWQSSSCFLIYFLVSILIEKKRRILLKKTQRWRMEFSSRLHLWIDNHQAMKRKIDWWWTVFEGKDKRESFRLTWHVYRSKLGQLNDVVPLKVMQEIVDKNPLSTQMKSLSKNELRYEHIQIDAVS